MAAVMIAAYDAAGEIRFVGDVPNGVSCGCICPTCGSPLVARQGRENEWHFAHEASQERPECLVGAMNLARGLGIEHLRRLHDAGKLLLPPYFTKASISTPWIARSQPVSWSAQLAGPLSWAEQPAKSHAVATGFLNTGASIAIFVQVGDLNLPFLDGLPTDCAYATLLVAPTWPKGTRTRDDALSVIASTALLRWGYQPDSLGIRAKVQQELEVMAEQERVRLEQIRAFKAEEARWRWSAMSRTASQGDSRSATPPTHVRYPGYPGHKISCSFQFFRLGDDQAWVFYPLDEQFVEELENRVRLDGPLPPKMWAIAPAHGAFEGWDECLPLGVGQALLSEGIYLVRDHLPAVMFLSPRSKVSASAQDPVEFQGK